MTTRLSSVQDSYRTWAAWTRALFLMGALPTVLGCDSSVVATPRANNHANSAFFTSGNVRTCESRCLAKTIPIIRARLGLDPGTMIDTPGGARRLMQSLRAECKASGGGSIKSVLVHEAISGVDDGSAAPAVLLDAGGHLYLLLGSINVDGQVLYQVVHGTSDVALVPAAELASGGWREAWQISNPQDCPVPIRVGSSNLILNGTYHNFGEVTPDQKLSHTFTIKNAGSIAVVVDKPSTSCGCTTTSVGSETVLKPGQTMSLGVMVTSSNTMSLRQTVLLLIAEAETGSSRQVALLLFGSQRRLMSVAPRALDFGAIVPGRSYSRTITLTEVATDRFTLKDVDPGELAFAHHFDEQKDQQGYRTYRVQCQFNFDGASAGKHLESLILATDSRFSPHVKVPVSYEVSPDVSIIPSIVALGQVRIGEPQQRRVRVVPRSGRLARIEMDPSPDGISVEVDDRPDQPELIITSTLKDPGTWERVIKANAQLGSKTERIEIRCVGFGTAF